MSDTPIKIGTLDRLNQLESFADQMKAAPVESDVLINPCTFYQRLEGFVNCVP